jgi:hypothetical protein
MGALNQINNGATTLVDWCHNDPTLEHSIGRHIHRTGQRSSE